MSQTKLISAVDAQVLRLDVVCPACGGEVIFEVVRGAPNTVKVRCKSCGYFGDLARQKKKLGRPPILKNPVYIVFWGEAEQMERVKAYAEKYDISMSEVLRIATTTGLERLVEGKATSRMVK